MTYHLVTKYSEYDVVFVWRKYHNGRRRLDLIDAKDGTPVMTPTVNVSEVQLSKNETIIKDYSENEGVLKFLQMNGIVGPVKREIGVGFVSCPIVDFLV